MQTQGRLMVGAASIPNNTVLVAYMDTHPMGGPGGAVVRNIHTGIETVYAAGVMRSLPLDWRVRCTWEPAEGRAP